MKYEEQDYFSRDFQIDTSNGFKVAFTFLKPSSIYDKKIDNHLDERYGSMKVYREYRDRSGP